MIAIELEQYLNKLEQEGKTKRTDLSLLEAGQNFKLDDNNAFDISYIYDAYVFYLQLIPRLGGMQEAFLKALKHEEIKRNQALENVDPFLIQVFMNSHHRSATNYAIKAKIENKDLTSLDLRRIHKILLNGLADDNTKSDFRSDNTSFVGTWQTKTRIDHIEEVSYLPLDYHLIDEAVAAVLNLYNQRKVTEAFDVLINPILIHGLIASWQMFRDGNTRLARILANVSLWDLTNNSLDTPPIMAPALYTSEALFNLNQRNYYRDLIKNIAINPNNETLNAWVKFNLSLIEKQIQLNQKRIEACAQTLVLKKSQKN